MKFTNGVWLLQKDVKIIRPAQVNVVETAPASLTVYAATSRVNGREDMHDISMLTLQFSSPMADVVRVKVSHFIGTKPGLPRFQILDQAGASVQVWDNDQAASLTSGALTVSVSKTLPWGIDFTADGQTLTSSGQKGLGLVEKMDGGIFMHEQLSLGVGEYVYGLGERFSAFVKNGQVVDIWNQDGGTASEQTYKNVPFYLTNHGYGVFVNHPGAVSFEVASENVSRVQFSVPGQELEYFVIHGPGPKAILEKYTALTGRPALPPAWSFGLWLSTSFTTSYDEKTVTSFIEGMAQRDLPLDVFHFDCFWMKEYHWCNLKWDERVFPDPQGMLSRLKAHGLHVCLWINPYIAQASEMFAEGAQNGYLLKKADGGIWQTDLWQPGMGIVDFTNPAARAWYQEKLRRLLRMGVDCFKCDFGERVPTDVVYWDGSDPQRMHNYYTYIYNQSVFEVIQQERGMDAAVVFARSATAGSQQFPVHWGGDCESTFESMAESLRGGLSLGLSGFGFWSHDIGGFDGNPPAAVYKRWIAFGLLSSHSRLHGSGSYRVPWLYDEEAVEVLRFFTHLKLSLMPYLYARALETQQHGIPLMRAMLLEFPDDPTCAFLDRQYMLGESLLVAPVFSEDGRVTYYLPAGSWTHFISGETRNGPGWFTETYDFFGLPLWVRPNSVLAVGTDQGHADYDYGDGVTLQLYRLEEGSRLVDIPDAHPGAPHAEDAQGATRFELRLTGNTLSVKRNGRAAAPWQVRIGNRLLSQAAGEDALSINLKD